MEPEGSLSHSQDPTACPYSETDQSRKLVIRGKKRFVGELQSQDHFLLYKYHQNGSVIEPGPLQWQTGE